MIPDNPHRTILSKHGVPLGMCDILTANESFDLGFVAVELWPRYDAALVVCRAYNDPLIHVSPVRVVTWRSIVFDDRLRLAPVPRHFYMIAFSFGRETLITEDGVIAKDERDAIRALLLYAASLNSGDTIL